MFISNAGNNDSFMQINYCAVIPSFASFLPFFVIFMQYSCIFLPHLFLPNRNEVGLPGDFLLRKLSQIFAKSDFCNNPDQRGWWMNPIRTGGRIKRTLTVMESESRYWTKTVIRKSVQGTVNSGNVY